MRRFSFALFALGVPIFPFQAACPTRVQISQITEPEELQALLQKSKPQDCAAEFVIISNKLIIHCPSKTEIDQADSMEKLRTLKKRASPKACEKAKSLIGQRLFTLLQITQTCLNEDEIAKEKDIGKLSSCSIIPISAISRKNTESPNA